MNWIPLTLEATPMEPAPVMSPTVPATAGPAIVAPTPGEKPSERSLVEAVPRIEDINGVPIHLTIQHANKTPIVDNAVVPIKRNSNDELDPPPGKIGWYGPVGWPIVPGNLSDKRGILAGHVGGGGRSGVFRDLDSVRRGDIVTLTYELDNGSLTVAKFVVTKGPLKAPKNDVYRSSKYDWVWESSGEERVITLFTCNLEAQHIDGHSIENWIVQATRTE